VEVWGPHWVLIAPLLYLIPNRFLGVFTKLQKGTVSFIMSLHLSVHIE